MFVIEYSWEFAHWSPSISAAISKYLKLGFGKKRTVSPSFGASRPKSRVLVRAGSPSYITSWWLESWLECVQKEEDT